MTDNTARAVVAMLRALSPLTHEERLDAIALTTRLWMDVPWSPCASARDLLTDALRRTR